MTWSLLAAPMAPSWLWQALQLAICGPPASNRWALWAPPRAVPLPVATPALLYWWQVPQAPEADRSQSGVALLVPLL